MAARSRRGIVALVLLAGCGSAARQATSTVSVVVEQAPDESLLDLISAALAADARLEPASPLYAEGATVVANGEARHLPPRYAGLMPGGEVSVGTVRTEVRPGVAWATVEYRWVSAAEGTAREGMATFVLVPAGAGGAGWRILHAHSSSPPGP